MRKRRTLDTVVFLALLLLGPFGTGLARTNFITYDVSVNTSSISGSNGYLDFQFNPGGDAAAAASATITNFTTDGTLNPTAPYGGNSGDVTGSLPGTVTLTNGTAYNDYNEGFIYGKSITFDVTLSGPAIGSSGTVGSSFGFSLYACDDATALLTTDHSGTVVTVDANADGSTTAYTFPATQGGSPLGSASATPEPSSIVLFMTALPACFLYLTGASWRRRQRSA